MSFNAPNAPLSSILAAEMSIADVLSAIKHYDMTAATHHMYAVILQNGSSVQEYTNDDGEYGGAREILKS